MQGVGKTRAVAKGMRRALRVRLKGAQIDLGSDPFFQVDLGSRIWGQTPFSIWGQTPFSALSYRRSTWCV